MSQPGTTTDATVPDVTVTPADKSKRTKLLVPRYCVACIQLATSYDRKSFFHRYDGLFF